VAQARPGGHLVLGVATVLAGLALIGIGVRPGAPGPPPQPPSPVLAAPEIARDSRALRARAQPPSKPIRITIPAIGVAAAIVPLGLQPGGEIEVPSLKQAREAGWYQGGPTPGELGPAVIVGHVDSKTGPGVFYSLGTLQPGQSIRIARADGSDLEFRISRIERVPKDHFPRQRIYGMVNRPELRLITCGGPFDRARGHYTDNVVVFASLWRDHALD
jgi:hypothetical protein